MTRHLKNLTWPSSRGEHPQAPYNPFAKESILFDVLTKPLDERDGNSK